ncbi:MAG TPA: hypothetical protein VM009_01330 [Terriglobales bacterium]|nr:hypothetical protein [Terriglobales bacterium]
MLTWKGDASGNGSYADSILNPQNVNVATFGKIATFTVDGPVLAQPLYFPKLEVTGKGTFDVVFVASERDSVYAFDASGKTKTPLWERHYAINGVEPSPDDYGGRTTIGGSIGITGTPVIDPASKVMYFVTMVLVNGNREQWLRAINLRDGSDFGPGSVKIAASVPGDGQGSSGGQLPFDPSIQNQRPGLRLLNGQVLIAWGSFSDWGVYHGWLMAYDAATLQQKAVFTPTPSHQANDDAFGPADHGGGGAFWQGGAGPTIDAAGNIYLVAADGSFNADEGGKNFGDTVLKLALEGNTFKVLDYFTPANQACVNEADLEIGSGGFLMLPTDATAGRKSGITINKEGRLYLLNADNLGKHTADDSQIPQQFMVGNNTCFAGMGVGFAEGPDWERLYGNPSYWNGNVYVAPSNGTLRQYAIANGILNPVPVAQSPTASGQRGGNTVVSHNGGQNPIVWMYEKSANGNAVLHAYDGTNIGKELWNSGMNAGRDSMTTGHGFGTPVVADGRVIAHYNKSIAIYGLLP